jgi:hypothetical protein
VASINIEHGVSADEADVTTSWPGKRARVEESPGLAENSVGRQLSTISDSIANKVSLVVIRILFVGSLGHLNGRDGGMRSRPIWLGLGGFHLYGSLLHNNGFLLLGLLMQSSGG